MTRRLDATLIPKAPDFSFENALWENTIHTIAGVDEAGRGAWAGPVFAAAVILPRDFLSTTSPCELRDSKQLSPAQRASLEPFIKSVAAAWGVGCAVNTEIDSLGILPATKLAMTRALEALSLEPQHILVDALLLSEVPIAQTSLLKGDQRSVSIAAASILAKTARDRWMEELALRQPGYIFERHKGYGTRAHQSALERLGPCPEHRFSFSPIKRILRNSQP